ncbi:MAG: Holliday junction branch migration DNA helicase RuvB [Candidatus Magasanikbacteria bacterium CG11_big_fil_rev_8_21_14_0_20_39_34]|uniref:Holliday junction branch migration complex subunit RuvB n=1 Tax=Candidatus Magasanikbacteria bacterium CG11_big_fil_rev_8_21_14_0_20_39_34 TaxID=1974653 RepID=A0A2H0N6G7_9BACT|nr:MAG: Holliday junction branch migration DNA helicase RuvB [Candidatus Magasanikbacteria bacterium CG11_big_fil_rev_8_21_14_0_20_39_34]
MEEERPLQPELLSENEANLEQTLRPQFLGHFIGQDTIKKQLHIAIAAAGSRDEPIEHVLLYGNPGLGKTTLAHIIAREMQSNIKVTSGPALEKVGDLAAILSNLEKGDVLFIDEIHRLNKTIEEVLYSAMEDFALDIIIGKGPTARTLRMPLEPFTLIGATTRMNLISGPLRDRFGHLFHLNFYTPADVEKIVQRSSSILDVNLQSQANALIANRARRTPRVANRLLKRVRDYATVHGDGIITEELALAALNLLDIDQYGLDTVDRKILIAIIEKFQGGPVGLSTLAAATSQDMDTLEIIYEPYLLQIGMLERTPRGRKVTDMAIKHIQSTQKSSIPSL